MAEEQLSRPSPFSRPPTAPPPVIRGVTRSGSASSAPVAPARAAGPTNAQSLPLALVAGLAAAAAGAAIWATITLVTSYQIGWMAVGVGFLVGWAVRLAGRGTTTAFGVLGAALALGGCLAGNLLTGCVLTARELQVGILGIVAGLTPAFTIDVMSAMFNPIDLLFYGLAIYQGYRFSIVGSSSAG